VESWVGFTVDLSFRRKNFFGKRRLVYNTDHFITDTFGAWLVS